MIQGIYPAKNSKDKHILEFPTTVRLLWSHNHPLHTASVLRHRDMGEDSKDRIYQLYNAGHSPMSAYHHFVEQLKATEANFVTAFADRKKMPRKDVRKEDRPHVFKFMKNLVYASSPESFELEWEDFPNDPIFTDNERVSNYFMKMYNMRTEWALAFRNQMLTRGQTTNSIAEAAFRKLKDLALRRQKCYNVVQLADVLVNVLPKLYQTKILNALHKPHSFVPQQIKKAMEKATLISKDDIVQLNNDIFHVKSQTTSDVYIVNMDIGAFSCPIGHCGSVCKHQLSVFQFYNKSHHNLPVTSQEHCLLFLEIATGGRNVPDGWFVHLNASSTSATFSPEYQHHATEIAETDASSGSRPKIPSDPTLNLVTLEDLTATWHKVSDDILRRVKQDPDTLLQPFEQYMKNYESCQTQTALATALALFNKQSHVTGQGRYIQVQPTALAHRKYVISGARSSQGRHPSKVCLKRKEEEECASVLPRTKRPRLLHSLKTCNKKNTPIGH